MSRGAAKMVSVVVSGLYLGGCILLCILSVAAAFGAVHPMADLLNHIQPLLFFGGIFALLFCLIVHDRLMRAFAMTLAATGLVASAFVYVPEFVVGLSTRFSPEPTDRPVYRLMTFNVFGRNEEPETLADYIIRTDTDIVALQEYHPDVRGVAHGPLAEHYPHFQYCAGGQRAFLGLYSKLAFEPLSEDVCSASISNPERTARIVVRFAPPVGEPFALATTHNDWPEPVTRQAEQFASLRDALATVELPLLLAGDFNSTPWSYTLRGFVAEAGLTRFTYNQPTFPKQWYYFGDWRPTPAILPIDHVMGRGDIEVHDLHRGEPSGSDHLPIIVTFSVNGEN